MDPPYQMSSEKTLLPISLFCSSVTSLYKIAIGENRKTSVNQPEPEILSDAIRKRMRTAWYLRPRMDEDNYRVHYADFDPGDIASSTGFHYAVRRTNQTDSEVWLAAYVGNAIANVLGDLNDILTRIEVEKESDRVQTRLRVKWNRVGMTLGGLTFLQVVIAGASIWICRGNLEIVDDVTVFMSMFRELTESVPGMNREGIDPSYNSMGGCFVRDVSTNDFRWVFIKGERRFGCVYV